MSGEAQRADAKVEIPHFESYEEEATWWDAHADTDLVDDLGLRMNSVPIEVHLPLGHLLNVSLDGETFTALQARADTLGVGPSSLVKMWVLERLSAGD